MAAARAVAEIRLEVEDSIIAAVVVEVEMAETAVMLVMVALDQQVYSLFDMLVVLPQVVEQ